MSELKPCPFCGLEDFDFQHGTPDREGIPINVICANCGACGPWVYACHEHEKSSPIEQWNTRAEPPEGEK